MKRSRPILVVLVSSHLLAAGLAYHRGLNAHSSSRPPSMESLPRAKTDDLPARPHGAFSLSDPRSAKDSKLDPPGDRDPLLVHLEATERAIRHLNADQLLQALQELAGRPTGPEKVFSQQLMLARLTEIDATLALGYAATLPSPENQTSELSVLSTWTQLDPRAAAAHFTENSGDFGALDARQRAAARTIAEQWAQSDPVEAFEWASQLPEEVRLDALAPAIAKLSLTQSDRIVEAINHRDPGPERTEMIAQVAGERARQAPEQTANWAALLTDPEEQSSASAAVVTRWAAQDPGSAAQWVKSLSPGPARDAALRSLLDSSAFRHDPSVAIRWTGAIRDENLRQEAIASIVNRWEVLDPNAAADWSRSQDR